MAGRIGKKQIRQNKRIHQGVKSGELTLHEARMLKREQHRIQRTKKGCLADGVLTPRNNPMTSTWNMVPIRMITPKRCKMVKFLLTEIK
ncbi:MAG: hypothetical protein JRC89_11445 [Deltaproteobacteria bacterium]|nr:hypothetical protein [Deltaproteobacteria bacterium]